jgi:hypothetical protein
VGDSVEVPAPGGSRSVEIAAVHLQLLQWEMLENRT